MLSASSPILLLHAGLWGLVSCMLAIASLNDIAVRSIPDLVPIGLVVLGILVRLADGNAVAGCVASIGVFLAAGLCWRFGWLGGGDVKLLAACAWLVSPALVPQLILLTALAGGGLAGGYLALGWMARTFHQSVRTERPRSLIRRICRAEWWRIRRRAPLPYGCAISAAALLTLAGG
jgi:prepilin peptidase CpaA